MRGPEESDFDLTAVPCLYFTHCMGNMPFLCAMNLIAINFCEKVVVCLKWGSCFIFRDIHMSQPLQDCTLLCKGVEKHLLISTEKVPTPPQYNMGNTYGPLRREHWRPLLQIKYSPRNRKDLGEKRPCNMSSWGGDHGVSLRCCKCNCCPSLPLILDYSNEILY